jgi:hypothetical protein
MRRFAFWLPLTAAVACESSPRSYRLGEVPSELTEPVAAADSAITTLQQRLMTRLGEELAAGGPLQAVQVCRDEAQTITAEVEHSTGLAVGRTSHRLRNATNAPRPWARTHLEAAARTGTAEPIAVVADDRVGVLRPIFVAAPCLQCHGDAQQIAPDVLAALRAAYPDDHAIGFRDGDLRGFFWAEAPLR